MNCIPDDPPTFQDRVYRWVRKCFGVTVANDVKERNFRFLEEALELVQSLGCSRTAALQLVDYVYGRPVGNPPQEVGGVSITFNALCTAAEIDRSRAEEHELERIWDPEIIEGIRSRQESKRGVQLKPIGVEQPIDPSDHAVIYAMMSQATARIVQLEARVAFLEGQGAR